MSLLETARLGDDERLAYRERGGKWQLATTEAGAAALGGPACFSIEGEEILHNIPSQHFDALLKPWIPQI